MKMRFRKLTTLLLSAAASVTMAMSAAAGTYSVKNYGSTDFITHDQFNAILQTLRDHRGEDTSGTSTRAYFTGVACSLEEAEKIIKTFSSLYMGLDRYALYYVPAGNYEVYLSDTVFTDTKREFSVDCISADVPYTPAGLYAGWLSGADPEGSLRQHDEAAVALQNILAAAPQSDMDFYQYMYDWLCVNVDYGQATKRISCLVYGALINRSATCSGYSNTFMAACFATGRKCCYVSCLLDGERHSRNLVFIDGVPKWVDATYGDKQSGIDYSFFMQALDNAWASYFSEPYLVYN